MKQQKDLLFCSPFFLQVIWMRICFLFPHLSWMFSPFFHDGVTSSSCGIQDPSKWLAGKRKGESESGVPTWLGRGDIFTYRGGESVKVKSQKTIWNGIQTQHHDMMMCGRKRKEKRDSMTRQKRAYNKKRNGEYFGLIKTHDRHHFTFWQHYNHSVVSWYIEIESDMQDATHPKRVPR